MEPDPRLVDGLKRLAAGQFDANDWLEWWENNADWVTDQLNRGQCLRLKPRKPGGFGPPSRCALVSQQEAFNLLDQWGIEHETSDRYKQEWEADFEKLKPQWKEEKAEKQKQFRPRLDCLKHHFPKFATFLNRNLDEVEELGEAASNEEIQKDEEAHGIKLPESFRKFLSCANEFTYRDTLQIGLWRVFRHPDAPHLPSAGMICFGDYRLEGDGDQVLFAEAEPGKEPAVLYYNHSEPSVRVLADDFTAWVESLPDTLDE